MVVYGNKEAEENTKSFTSDLSGKTIKFKSAYFESGLDLQRYYKVYIDNLLIGSIFDLPQVKALDKEYIEKVYAKLEEKTGIDKEGELIKEKRIYLFVKYIDIE